MSDPERTSHYLKTLRSIRPPDPLIDRNAARRTFETGMSLEQLEQMKIQGIIEILSHPSLDELIDQGDITLGLIKPSADQGVDLPADDDEAASKIIDEIGDENIIFSLPIQLSKQQTERFYEPNKSSQQKMSSKKNPDSTIWDDVVSFMSSGPLTLLLIYRQDGNAISWWREKMGPTMVEIAKSQSPGSIRGKYARELPNNLVHGSDSPESVKREIGVVRDVISELVLERSA